MFSSGGTARDKYGEKGEKTQLLGQTEAKTQREGGGGCSAEAGQGEERKDKRRGLAGRKAVAAMLKLRKMLLSCEPSILHSPSP